MNKKILKQYISLKKEIVMLDKKLKKIDKRIERVPVVAGKVKGSSPVFPYIETHVSVEMAEPKKAAVLKKQRAINERRKEQAESMALKIEEFISTIPDSLTRQIFDKVFIQGKTQEQAGEELSYSKGRISQIINDYTKD